MRADPFTSGAYDAWKLGNPPSDGCSQCPCDENGNVPCTECECKGCEWCDGKGTEPCKECNWTAHKKHKQRVLELIEQFKAEAQ